MTTAAPKTVDQLPPFDTEAEAGCLACVLTADANEAGAMLAQLAVEDFYDQRHRVLFQSLAALQKNNLPLDVVALSQRVRDKGNVESAGGLEYLMALPEQTPSPANFPSYLETVKDRTARRAILRDAGELALLARDTSISPDSLADAVKRVGEAHSRNGAGKEGLTIRTPAELLAMQFDDSDRILGDRLLATGQSLVIVGAGSIGKSRLLLQMAVCAITGRPFVSFETRGEALRWLILQAENSNRRLHDDLAALMQWTGANVWQRVNEQLTIHTLESDADSFLSVGDPAAHRRIADTLARTNPDVVCFDSLYNFAIGDLNTDQDMSATLLTLSRLARTGNPHRAIIPLHHALTGKAGAARATGYDRASFGRNSKVLHSWTRGQINVAPGSPDPDGPLVLSCGKCSNGREFAPFAVQLNPETMIYEVAQDFDLEAWQAEVAGGKSSDPLMTPAKVRDLCQVGGMDKAQLAKAIMEDCGCYRGSAYRYIAKAEKAKAITLRKSDGTYFRK